MTSIRLAAEYGASPIFCTDSDQMRHLELDELPISEQLRRLLKDWDEAFQVTFNDEYPPDSRFPSEQEEIYHLKMGQELSIKLREELGEGYTVTFQV